jgi:hypothetical protein
LNLKKRKRKKKKKKKKRKKKEMVFVNQALLARLGWKLISNPSSLWVDACTLG